MRFATIALAAAAALTSTFAAAEPAKRQFVHEGQTYNYTITDLPGGRRLIEGRRAPSGAPFRLVVRGDRVTGTAGGVPVAFSVAQARGATVLASAD